jgi:hypothetical protein
MPDDPTSSPGANGGQPQAGAQDDQESSLTPEQLRAALAATRGEAAQYRTKSRELEAQVKLLAQSQMTEAEKQAEKIKELEQLLERVKTEGKKQNIAALIEARANKLGIVDGGAASKLMDWDSVETDDESGLPKAASVDKALNALLKLYPFLAQSGGSRGVNGGSRSPEPRGYDMNSMIRRVARGS